mgnify:CR=1 FL=1
MDKKSIIGIAVVAVLFLGFAYMNTKEQEKYQQEMARWQAYQDSLAVAAADSVAAAAVRERQVEALGATLAAAREAEAEEFTVENDVMAVRFSTRGGQVTGVTLKDYKRYAPRGEEGRPVEMMDPATARFGMTFYVKNGLRNVDVNTLDYVFEAEPVAEGPEGEQVVVMRLPVSGDASLEYRYTIYDTASPERDYLVGFDVRLVNMAREMANQTQIQIDWSNTSYQNEKGFKNENMYTTCLLYTSPSPRD